MDQKIIRRDKVTVPCGSYRAPKYRVKYRGWFFNDEVLMLGWPYNIPDKKGWEMAFEALLRCGGNMAVPGTDKMAEENRQLASDYGLWITHHHAEPLGAEMFKRAYPALEADYFKYQDKFEKLWEDAVIAQKDMKVVWNLCFRGQGDCPFWENDRSGAFDTDEKRGRVISDLILRQAGIVKKYVKNPVFCTNLYGEIMELYEEGFVTLPENIILVKADNGYGRMVTRRRGNHNPRISSMPDPSCDKGQGIYYHVSFYDLQAANQLTMMPNSLQMIADELEEVLKKKGGDFWLVNCSNVRPHIFFLDALSKIWSEEGLDADREAISFAGDYFEGSEAAAKAYADFHTIAPAFGSCEDEHAGEQFYTDNIRYFAHYAILGRKDCIEELIWLTGRKNYRAQLEQFARICGEKLEVQKEYLSRIPDSAVTLKLQAQLHYYGNLGVQAFSEGYARLEDGDHPAAFYRFGQAAEYFELADRKMQESAVGVWTGFYANDCQADYRFTAYMIRKLMSYVREFGDNSEHYLWQHEYVYSPEDRGVKLLLLTARHSTDEEIYIKMKETEEKR